MNDTPLPPAPRRVIIAHDSHDAMSRALLAACPQLEVRGVAPSAVTDGDLLWGEAYIGFRHPALSSMGNIRWVHSTGAGVDPWFYPSELPRTILLTRSSESFGPLIAEWTIARALAVTQRLPELFKAQTEQRWEKFDVPMLAGTTAVVVGIGDVGAHVAHGFKAMGCRVRGVSRSGAGDVELFEGISPVSDIAIAVEGAQWVVLMLPLTDETRALIGRDVLKHCRGAVLMNAGRGAVVDESVLPEALQQGWLSGAALDVFEEEPLPQTSPLWSDSRVMISPHIAGLTTVDGAVSGFVECLHDLEQGRLPKWVVNRARQY